jgi:hypothetical protein
MQIRIQQLKLMRIRIRNPAFLAPGSGIGKNSDPGSRMNIPDHLSESVKAVVWVKNTLMRIRIRDLFDPGSGTRMEKFGSGIRNKHPGASSPGSYFLSVFNALYFRQFGYLVG